MTHAVVSVNEQGRVTIPAQLRRELSLEPGSTVVAYTDQGRLILEHRDHLAARLQAEARASRTTTGSTVDDLISDRRVQARQERAETEDD